MRVVDGKSLAAMVLVLLAGVASALWGTWDVKYTSKSICGLKGASISLSCTYKYPKDKTVERFIWFVKEAHATKEPVDLREDGDYKGRVHYIQKEQNKCILRIDDLRESDARTYKFRFSTNDQTGRFTGEPGVTLKVTDLKVTKPNQYLKCSGQTCHLLNPTYIWYRNGQAQDYQHIRADHQPGSYSCAIQGYENLRSATFCVWSNGGCWSVSYTNRTFCALVGSSVTIDGYYTHPNWPSDPQLTWYKQGEKISPVEGRVEILNVRNNWSTIRLNNVTPWDAASYKATIMYWNNVMYEGHYVPLSVTDLSVTVTSKSSAQQSLVLHCTSSCVLPNNPTYIWHKNGQQMNGCESASCTIEAEHDVSYRCAVKGHEKLLSPPVYPPKNTSAAVFPSKELKEGGSVKLTCSCLGANPPVLGYSWFKREANADRRIQDGQQNYSIAYVSSRDTGLYYCGAHNQLGQQNSSVIRLDVLHPPKNTTVMVISSEEMAEGSMVTLVCDGHANPPIHTYHWFKQDTNMAWLVTMGQNYSISNISSDHSGIYYCTAQNQLGQQNSTPKFLNVLYAPRIPFLSTIPSTSTNSITVRCESDANPIGSYTWHRKTLSDDIYIGNSTNLTLDVGDARIYYCVARNHLGSLRSVEWSTRSDSHVNIYTSVGCTVLILLIVVAALAAVLYMRRGTVCAATSAAPGCNDTEEENSGKQDPAPIYCNVSDVNSARMSFSNNWNDVLYSTVHFTHHPAQGGPLYSTQQKPPVPEGEVEYAVVNHTQPRAAQSDTIYSTVQRT